MTFLQKGERIWKKQVRTKEEKCIFLDYFPSPHLVMIGLYGRGDRRTTAWRATLYLGLASMVLLAALLMIGTQAGGEKGNAGIRPVWLDVWGSILRHFLLVGQ